jgi:hypothetical protein
MGRLISTLILIVVLAGLGGYIYFVDRERPVSGTEEAKPKAFDVSPENIEEVQITNAAGEKARVQRVDANWLLVEPEKADADATAVASVTSSVASLEVQRVVDENPSDLTQYGLNPPKIDLAFRVKDQKDFQRLLVGDKTPTGGDLYAKKANENKVFLISSFVDSSFNRTAFDFRDKTILKFEREMADGVEIVSGATTVQLSRTGTEWRLLKPVAVRADYAGAEGIITRLSTGQMQRVVANETADLGQYGLDRPSVSATVSSGSSRATLLLGRATEGGFFAKDAARPVVFAVDEGLATELKKTVADLRRKDIFDARSFTANRIELRRGAESYTFEKTKEGEKDVWKNASGQVADSAKVEDLMTKLSNLRAVSFEPSAPAALKTPALTVTVRYDEDKTETATFGRSGADVYGSRADEPAAAKLEASVFDEAMKALDAMK